MTRKLSSVLAGLCLLVSLAACDDTDAAAPGGSTSQPGATAPASTAGVIVTKPGDKYPELQDAVGCTDTQLKKLQPQAKVNPAFASKPQPNGAPFSMQDLSKHIGCLYFWTEINDRGGPTFAYFTPTYAFSIKLRQAASTATLTRVSRSVVPVKPILGTAKMVWSTDPAYLEAKPAGQENNDFRVMAYNRSLKSYVDIVVTSLANTGTDVGISRVAASYAG